MLDYRKTGWIVLLTCAALGGCTDPVNVDGITASLGESFELDLGQTAKINGERLKVTFSEVIQDNRCPANAYCIWPGTAQIELFVDVGGPTYYLSRLDLLAGADSATLDMFSEDVLGYNLRFEALAPYPGSQIDAIGRAEPSPPSPRARLKISRAVDSHIRTVQTEIADIQPSLIGIDPFNTDSLWIIGDTLFLNVTYGGGCQRHYCFLVMSPSSFAESNPVQANLYPRHFGNQDECDGLLKPTIRFELSPVSKRYRQLYGRVDPILLNVYDYFESESGRVRSILYVPLEEQ